MALLSTEKILEYIPSLFETDIKGNVDIFKKLEKILVFDEGFIYFANPDSLQLKYSYKKHSEYKIESVLNIDKQVKDSVFDNSKELKAQQALLNTLFLTKFELNSFIISKLRIKSTVFGLIVLGKKEKDFYKYLCICKDDETDELKTLREQLANFYDKYQAWLKELDFEGQENKLPGNSHRFGFLDMSRNYNDIILKEAVVDHETKSRGIIEMAQEWLAGADRSNSNISSDYLVTRLNYHIRDNANGNGHYDTKNNSLRVNHEPEWVYADILHASAKDGFCQL